MELVLRLLLGGVLLAAAGGKLRARAAARDGLIAAGVPAALAPAAVIALAVVEAALAAAVLAGIAPRAAGLAACALGLLFAAVLGAARLRGRRALPCGCFGGDGARPTWLLIARALGLAALGAVVAIGDLPAISRDAALVAALVVLALAVAVLFALVLALYRQVGVLALRVAPRTALELAGEGPELGDVAPPLPGLDRDGAVLVAFGSPGCRLCRALEPGAALAGPGGRRRAPRRRDGRDRGLRRLGRPGDAVHGRRGRRHGGGQGARQHARGDRRAARHGAREGRACGSLSGSRAGSRSARRAAPSWRAWAR